MKGDVLGLVVNGYGRGRTSDYVMEPMYPQQGGESGLVEAICCVANKLESRQDDNSLRHGDHQIYSRPS